MLKMKCTQIFLLLLLILDCVHLSHSKTILNHSSTPPSSSSSPCNPSDRSALLNFKSNIIQDTTETLSSWVGPDCCGGDWEGVQCNPSSGRVTSLTLQNPSSSSSHPQLYMKGTLSPSLGNLQYLETLVISGMKRISGPIPSTILNLKHLTQLILEDNALTGTIPSTLGTKLTSLNSLSLSGNKFHGSIPSSLPSLNQLNLARNRFTGPLPVSIKSLHSLQFLDLSRNLISSQLLDDFFSQFHNLTFLDLSFNFLSGPLPCSIFHLPNLSYLSFANNHLTGPIPDDIGVSNSLTSLSLSTNHLTGPIPDSLAKLNNLWYLNLSRNALTNPIPVSFVNALPSLLSLDLSHNKFVLDAIPRWLLTRELSALHLAGCGLSTPIPNFTKPDSFTSLDLSHNTLHDDKGILRLFNRMKNLQSIDLSNNRFKFSISSIILPNGLSSLDLSSNHLVGPITAIINNRTSRFLESVDVSSNSITGTLPNQFKQGSNLKLINASNNRISGVIPSSISGLVELQRLDLSRNRITGTIPPSFSRLVKLQWLDLSINRLQGRIPSMLLRISNLRHVNFRSNEMCGEIPQGRPFNIFPKAAYAHNKCLCGKPLPPC